MSAFKTTVTMAAYGNGACRTICAPTWSLIVLARTWPSILAHAADIDTAQRMSGI